MPDPLRQLGAPLGDVGARDQVGLQGLQVDIHPRNLRELRPQLIFQLAARAAGLGERGSSRELRVHRQVQAAVGLLLDGHVVEVLEATHPAGRGMHALDQVGGLSLAFDHQGQLDVGQRLVDGVPDVVGEGLGALHRQRPLGGHPGIRQQVGA